MRIHYAHSTLSSLIALTLLSQNVLATHHEWRFNEVFSNADGTVQFVELFTTVDFQTIWDNHQFFARLGDQFNELVITRDLKGSTASRHVLLATERFATLPGAITPDFILPDNFLFTPDGAIEFFGADFFPYEGLPLDGVSSRSRDGSTSINSPTNLAGESGSVDASPPVPAASTWGIIALLLALLAFGSFVFRRLRPGGRLVARRTD